MKNLLIPVFLLLWLLELNAQQGMYRHYPQVTSSGMSWAGNPQAPIRAVDGGYLLTNWLLYMGFESPGGMGSPYVIKTDSNFIPQWKKDYAGAIPLATGGVILFKGNAIEKVTASGVQVWIKHFAAPVMLNDGVVYGDKIRFVGNTVSYTNPQFVLAFFYTSDGVSILTDTSGTYISSTLFQSSVINFVPSLNYSYRGSAEFSKIKRDGQGNFIVYSQPNNMSGIGSNMSIAKFDSSFSFVWAKGGSGNNNATQIHDIEILSNGRIFASAATAGVPYWNSRASLLKFDQQGSLMAQCYFDKRISGSDLLKKPNGNFVTSIRAGDSIFMLEVDTSMNVLWNKFAGNFNEVGGSTIRSNTLFTSMQYEKDFMLISNDLNGNSCSSYSISYTKLTSTVSLVNLTLTPVSYSTSIVTGTLNSITSQIYIDSCKCPVFIPVLQNKLCIGNSGTISIVGTGNLSWYSSSTGNSFIQSGPQFIFSSSTPTSLTIYAQDSACVLNPIRTPIDIIVYGPPTLTLSAWTPTICKGNSTLLFASGANTYTWNNFNTNGYSTYVTPTATAIYAVTGELASGCSGTQTIQVTVVPSPTISVTPPSTIICAGSSVNLVASGATSYTWPGIAVNTPSIIANTPWATFSIYSVVGSNGFCTATGNATLTTLSSPNITITGSQNICSGISSTLLASGATTYTWSTSSNNASIIVTQLTSSVYTVNGSLQNGCKDTETISILVTPSPTVLVSSSASSVCIGDPITFSASGASSYSWSNGLTTNSFVSTIPYGTTTYTVSGTNGACTSTSVIQVYGSPVPSLGISLSDVLCLGKTCTIAAFMWWSGPSSYTLNNTSVSNHTIVTPTSDFDLIVTGSNAGCAKTDTFNFAVHPNPTITVAQSQNTICSGQSFVAMASGANSYNWNNLYLPPINIATFSPNMSTIYYVVGYNSFGCSSDTLTFSISVYYYPQLNVNINDSIICPGQTTTLSATGAYSYSWSTSQSSPTVLVSPSSTTIYTVVGTSSVGCSKTATVIQIVDLCSGLENVSNDFNFSVFPNPGNSKFYVNIPTISSEMLFEVYNSIGQLVLESMVNGPNFSFDLGEYSSGVYYLKITDSQSSYLHKILKQ